MNRKTGIAIIKMRLTTLIVVGWMVGVVSYADEAPFFATGIKIGEVSDSSAIVWTRLTRNEHRLDSKAPLPVVRYRNISTGDITETTKAKKNFEPLVEYPNGSTIDTIEGAAPGAEGLVRVQYRVVGTERWRMTDWVEVISDSDFIHQFALEGLESNARYEVEAQSRRTKASIAIETITGGFRTAPRADEAVPITFTVSTGQAYRHLDMPDEGYKIYGAMLQLDPHFFIHTGDILYYDLLGKTKPLARWHWARTYSLPTNVEFHRQVSSYFIKDDHDTWMNDCWPSWESPFMGDFTFKEGVEIFLEQVPMGERTYRTVRWGKDLQLWMMEGRDFRSPNPMKDGPEKTIWGAEQMAWFQRTVEASDATFRVLVSPTPVVGPDRGRKNDNHANEGFTYEGNIVRDFISRQKNMVVVCGDRHWQYISEDPETGVREYSCGPASDEHAGGWSHGKQTEHEYLNVVGGFMSMTVDRADGNPRLMARHYDVNGQLLNEDVVQAE